jgi:hypothetical protein
MPGNITWAIAPTLFSESNAEITTHDAIAPEFRIVSKFEYNYKI